MRTFSGFSARRILIDTSAYVALIAARELDHAAASSIRARLIAERWRLFTTTFVLAETHALLLAREGRDIAAHALWAIGRSTTVIIRASARDERCAREIIEQYSERY